MFNTKEVVEIPITLKEAKENEYVKTKILVYVVEANNVPGRCSRPGPLFIS